MGKFTICFLLLVLVVVFFKTSSCKLTIVGQRMETNKHESTKLFKRSSHWKGKGIVRCNDHSECPDGYACLRPGFENADSKSNKRCYECGCTAYSQCYFQNRSMSCNCSGSGFTGEFCETNIDDCIPILCNNNGSCIDQVNGYMCQCMPGYTGDHCENDIDDCIPITCNNNGTCIDQVNGYTCQCMIPWYTGDHCENDICIPSPCHEKEECVHVDDGYTCTCDKNDPDSITQLMATMTPTTICSPGFNAGGYGTHLYIQWKIIAYPGETITVTFTDFETEFSYDFVFVQDGLVNGLQTCLGILTGGPSQITMPQTFVSSTNELTVTFQTDGSITKNGFCFNFNI